jgi:hypothetical protein
LWGQGLVLHPIPGDDKRLSSFALDHRQVALGFLSTCIR